MVLRKSAFNVDNGAWSSPKDPPPRLRCDGWLRENEAMVCRSWSDGVDGFLRGGDGRLAVISAQPICGGIESCSWKCVQDCMRCLVRSRTQHGRGKARLRRLLHVKEADVGERGAMSGLGVHLKLMILGRYLSQCNAEAVLELLKSQGMGWLQR